MLIINILDKNPINVVDKILSCENIISSSLHGIIVSDAYKIPSLWVEFSDKVIGNGFKFFDYFESVGKEINAPFRIDKYTEFDDLLDKFCYDEIKLDLDKLIKSCPFKIIL